MKNFLFSIFLFILLFSLFTFNASAELGPGGGSDKSGGKSEPVNLNNPLTGDSTSISAQVLIGRIINAILSVVGSLALMMFIYGGFTWMMAGGNSEKVEKGKGILVWATIGLIVIFTSYALVNFVLTNVLKQGGYK
ncbi:MAG: pilin [Patescibacteria group bacterium]